MAVVSRAHGSRLFRYGSTMANEFNSADEENFQAMSEGSQSASIDAIRDRISSVQAVSYTHLTLPTIYSV